MSESLSLFCPETNQFVRIAEESGSWFRCDEASVNAVFCAAHLGMNLVTMRGVPSHDNVWPDEWTKETSKYLFEKVTGNAMSEKMIQSLSEDLQGNKTAPYRSLSG